MLVYLAELSHTGQGRSPNVVPLAAGYLAAALKRDFPDVGVKIFRDPNALLDAVKKDKPDVVGFSVYVWSERVVSFCARRVKEISGRIVTIAGGASIDDIDEELLRFFQANPDIDVCIPNQGEIGFINVIKRLKTEGALVLDEVIDGCAVLGSDGRLRRGTYAVPELSDLPSPYLEGILDEFLSDGYDPIIQSMRGCPYSCAFCVSGTKMWRRLQAFSLQRVFAEFEYIRARTTSKYLILTDENLGILKERDVAMAEYISNSFHTNGWPARLYFYSAKRVTPHVLKVLETLSPIGEFGMSFQTLDEAVRENVKRVNVQWDQFLEYLRWAKRRGIMTSTELIFGLGGESANSYRVGIEKLLSSGVDRVYSYNLRLFNGIDLSTQANRKKYEYVTRFRLPERTFGVYDDEVVTEIEEVVVGSNSFDFDDYLKTRTYGLFLELASGRGYLSEFIHLAVNLGLPGEKLISFLVDHDYAEHQRLRSTVRDYLGRSKSELFETPEQCTDYVTRLIVGGGAVPEIKLNLLFTGKIMLDDRTRAELLAVVKEFIGVNAPRADERALLTDYIDNVLAPRIVSLRVGEEETVRSRTIIDLDRLRNGDYGSVGDLSIDNGKVFELRLHQDAIDFVRRSPILNTEDEESLQNAYMKISRFGLLRTVGYANHDRSEGSR